MYLLYDYRYVPGECKNIVVPNKEAAVEVIKKIITSSKQGHVVLDVEFIENCPFGSTGIRVKCYQKLMGEYGVSWYITKVKTYEEFMQ